VQDLEAKFEAAANLIAKGTPTKGSASTDAPRSSAVTDGGMCLGETVKD